MEPDELFDLIDEEYLDEFNEYCDEHDIDYMTLSEAAQNKVLQDFAEEVGIELDN